MNITFDEIFDLPEIQDAGANIIDSFKDGKPVRFRIIGKHLGGYTRWKSDGDKKRSFVSITKPEPNPNINLDVKEVWAFPIFDKEDEKVKVLALKQIPLQKELKKLYEDSERGSFTKYDIKIERKGSTQKDTTYSATPLPPSNLTEDQVEIIKGYDVDLMAYFSGKDPITFDAKF